MRDGQRDALVQGGRKQCGLAVAAVADDGRDIDAETAERLFFVPAVLVDEPALEADAALETSAKIQLDGAIAEVERLTSSWFDETSQKLNRYAADMEMALDNEIGELEARVNDLRDQSRNPVLALDQKLALQREASKLDRQKDAMVAERFTRKRKIQDDVDKMLDDVGESLKLEPQIEPLFTLRWELTR